MFWPKITKEKNCQYLLPVIKHTFKQKKKKKNIILENLYATWT